ncbi:MAG: hypothetical protein HFH93_15545 [Lachnospiraceae bacterium]|nr:hypothetical protein [Lachnospiraceae bacterium]
MENQERPVWMTDPLVKDIPEKKLQFVEQLFAQGHGKSQKEMMAYLMPMMKKAKAENLTFTPQEMNAAIAAIRKHSTKEELTQIDKILEKSRGKDGQAQP